MPKGDKFTPGDLVFAKVKGYPAWPAKITALSATKKNMYCVFFYGTYEIATLKSEDIWNFTEERAEKFEIKYKKKKGYPEGIYQIRNTPEIAAIQEDHGTAVLTVDVDDSYVEPSDQSDSSPSKPSYSPPKPTKRKAESLLDSHPPYKKLAMSPSVQLTKAKIPEDEYSNKSYDEEYTSDADKTRSNESSPIKDCPPESTQYREGRKLWVKVKDTDDIIEISLDKDRPSSFESDEAKQEWERASAKKALKFKKRIESGELMPPEIKKRLEERAQLTPEEREQIDAERKTNKKKEKLRWLKIEQRIVELDIAVKTSLSQKRPSPDRCIQALDEIQALGILPLMLKKQPAIVTTIRRSRKYVGPVDFREWENEDLKNKLERSIPTIRNKSELVFQKFKSCLLAQNEDESSFVEKFLAEVDKLNEHVKDWEERKVWAMTRDPTQPLSASNPLSDFEDDEPVAT